MKIRINKLIKYAQNIFIRLIQVTQEVNTISTMVSTTASLEWIFLLFDITIL